MSDPIVSAQWLNEHLYDPELIILDASQRDNKSGVISDLENIQIKGSRYFDLKNTFSNKESTLPNMLPRPEDFQEECRQLGINVNSTIVVYDNLGIYTSPRVWWMFKAMGHKKIFVLNGGLPNWVQHKMPIDEDIESESFDMGDFTANFYPNSVWGKEQVLNNIQTKERILIDARSRGRFSGTEAEPRKDLKSGHIANSVNIPYGEVLNNGKFKSKAELHTIFSEFNVLVKPITFTCGSGITACIILLAYQLISENEISVFDGSWTEWAICDMPIETSY